MMKKKKPVNYIDNKTFYVRLVEYQKECYDADKEGVERPIIPNDIAICLQTIATRLATKPNYSGYIFKDDMIGDGIENAFEAVMKFDPAKGSNPGWFLFSIASLSQLCRIGKGVIKGKFIKRQS